MNKADGILALMGILIAEGGSLGLRRYINQHDNEMNVRDNSYGGN